MNLKENAAYLIAAGFFALLALIAAGAFFQEGQDAHRPQEEEYPPLTDSPGLDEIPAQSLAIGSCPTLAEDAAAFAAKNPGTDVVVFGSTAETLEALGRGEIDVAIVGRIASPGELAPGTEGKLLRGGYTLVSSRKALIDYSDLCKIEICTCLSEEEAAGILPPCANVHYHSDPGDALGCMDSAVLISWEEYSPEYNLLIPVENGKKVKSFRAMAVYYPSAIGSLVADVFGAGV